MRKRNSRRSLLRFLFTRGALLGVLLALLLTALLTPFSIRTVVLPFLAHSAGMTLTVDDARCGIFGGGRLTAHNLVLTDQSGNELSVEDLECKFDLLPLLAGFLHADSLQLHSPRLRVRSVPVMKSSKPCADSWRLDDLDVRSAVVHLPGGYVLNAERLSASGFSADTENSIHGEFRLCFPHAAGKISIPFRTDARWSRDISFQLRSAAGTLTLPPGGTGGFLERSLSDLNGRLLFDLHSAERGDLMNWKTTLELNGFGPADSLVFQTDGEYGTQTETGRFRAVLRSALSGRELGKLYPASEGNPVAVNLRMDESAADVEFGNGEIHWNGEVSASMDALLLNGKEFLKNTSLHLKQEGSFLPHAKKLRLRSAAGTLNAQGAEIRLVNDGSIAFVLDADGIHAEAGNTALALQMKSVPLALLNVFFPVEFTSGTADGDFRIGADALLHKLKGSLSAEIRDMAFSIAGKPFAEKHNISGSMTMESAGLEEIRSLDIRQCAVSASSDGKQLFHAALEGFCRFSGPAMKLSGTMDVRPYELGGTVRDPILLFLRRKLAEYHAESMNNHYNVELSFDRGERKPFRIHAETDFNSLAFIGEKYASHPLKFSFDSEASYLPDNKIALKFRNIRGEAPGLLLFTGSGEAMNPENTASFRLNLEKFVPELWNGLAAFADIYPDTLQYDSLRGNAAFSINAEEHSIRIPSISLDMIPTAGAHMNLTLDREIYCSWDGLDDTPAAMTIFAENLPLTWWNCFLVKDAPFRFDSGIVHGTAEITAKNLFRDLYFKNDILVENAVFSVCSAQRSPGDCRLTGTLAFPDYFRDIEFHDAEALFLRGAEPYLHLAANGSIGISQGQSTALRFAFDRTRPPALELLFGSLMESVDVTAFDASGYLRYGTDSGFQFHSLAGETEIRDLAFLQAKKANYPQRSLHGKVRLSMGTEPGKVRFRNSSIDLADAGGLPVLHFEADSGFEQNSADSIVECAVRSNALDLEYFTRVLSAKHRPDPENSTENDRSAVWPFRGEPPPFPVPFQRASVTADFSNVTFTKHLNMSFAGRFHAENGLWHANPVSVRINDATASASASADVSKKDGYVYSGNLHVSSLDAAPFVRAALESSGRKNEILSGLAGKVNALHLSLSGKGFSLNSLDKHLKLAMSADFEKLSIPPGARDTSAVTRLLLLPLENIPRLIEMIPNKPLRTVLRKAMGDHINLLTRKQNINFDSGAMEIAGSGTDLRIRKMFFLGPVVRFRVQRGVFNPFRNVLKVDSVTRIGGVKYPLAFRGTLDHPDLDLHPFVKDFLTINSISAADNTISLLSLGLRKQDKEEEWTQFAEDVSGGE